MDSTERRHDISRRTCYGTELYESLAGALPLKTCIVGWVYSGGNKKIVGLVKGRRPLMLIHRSVTDAHCLLISSSVRVYPSFVTNRVYKRKDVHFVSSPLPAEIRKTT